MHLVLTLLVAGALSLLAGLAVSEILALMPCQGEGLACRIDDAIGAYAVLIWATLGPSSRCVGFRVMGETNFDIAVIGAGPGGYVSAIRAAELG
jgi:hypothetical protein